MKSMLARVILLLSVTLLGACVVYQPVPGGRSAYPSARGDAASEYGVISEIERLSAQRQLSGGGGLTGSAAGAVIGRQFGGSGEGRAMGTFVGAILGFIIGNEIERQNTNLREGVRVSVRLDNGAQRSFDYSHAGDLRVGDRVRIEGGQLVRM